MKNAISQDDDYNYTYKIILLGDTSVGKTHLLQRYIKGSLPKFQTPTIGVEFATKTVDIGQGVKIRASIWDTAGQERYKAVTSAHYRKAEGALVIYDITKYKTFENVIKWIDDLKSQAEPDVVIMLVGNKIDLCERDPSMKKVSREQAKSLAEKYEALFEETSAITSHNVPEVFEKLLREIYSRKSTQDPFIREKNVRLVTTAPEETKKNSICCS